MKLGIFEKLKTRHDELSAKAIRQRAVIRMLAEKTNPQDRTRTGLAKNLAAATGSKWQTVYPAIFGDMEQVMIPLGIAQEEGSMPLRRGPRMMQERGSPYYALTKIGMVVALAISDTQGLNDILKKMGDIGSQGEALRILASDSPTVIQYIMRRYVEAWCMDESDLLPLDLGRVGADTPVSMCLELLELYNIMDRDAKDAIVGLLKDIVGR